MSIYSSREPFRVEDAKGASARNDDPYPNVWAGHSERNQMRTDTDIYREES